MKIEFVIDKAKPIVAWYDPSADCIFINLAKMGPKQDPGALTCEIVRNIIHEYLHAIAEKGGFELTEFDIVALVDYLVGPSPASVGDGDAFRELLQLFKYLGFCEDTAKFLSALFAVGPDRKKVFETCGVEKDKFNEYWKNLVDAGYIKDGAIVVEDLSLIDLTLMGLVAEGLLFRKLRQENTV